MGISEEGGSREEEISHFSISNPSSGSDVITVGLSSGTSRSVERRNARAPLIYLLSNTHETPPLPLPLVPSILIAWIKRARALSAYVS